MDQESAINVYTYIHIQLSANDRYEKTKTVFGQQSLVVNKCPC